ncbi:MAG: MFS transporter [Candidatus Hydrogenedentes bacterium]|nr:MFS transporter [Candidatus Hydrogenedentota bacterium]
MSAQQPARIEAHQQRLFWGCFIALIATACGFIVRVMILNEWGVEFNLSESEKGQIIGVGFWPFAVSIVLFSLVIDKIGYKAAMIFAFVCHALSAVVTIFATGYEMLWIGTFIAALGNGTVEAFINPVVATIFHREKTKWLNILHAGWPGGMVLGGIIAVLLGVVGIDSWQVKVGLILIPTIIYGVMLINQEFPVHERVASGVSYQAMLKEVGIIGALIVSSLMTIEVCRFFGIENYYVRGAIALALTGAYGFYVKSLGQPLFIFLLFIMMPLATTELGTDGWITSLMENAMGVYGLPPVTVLLYTSVIMMTLRFFAGPIVHRFSPIGLLMGSAVVAILGLVFLSKAAGIGILLAATLYAFGKTFFWPTMLGVVAEQFPKGGAMTLNTIAGVGMLAVGIVGAPFLGYFQDNSISTHLQQQRPELYEEYTTEKTWALGHVNALDQEKLKAASEEDRELVMGLAETARKSALMTVAIFPCIMLVCYIILFFYFKAKGGYKVVHIDEPDEAVYES